MDDREVDFLARFVEESNAIEGIANEPNSARTQLLRAYPFGHVGVLVMLHDAARMRMRQMTEVMVFTTQAMIVREQPSKGMQTLSERHIGCWRDCEVTVGGRSCEAARFVPMHMRHLITEVRWWQKQYSGNRSVVEAIRFIARFHWQYELVHPFVDGNGRSGRALVYYLYRWAGLRPFVFTHDDRFETYYPCFNESASARMESYFLARTRLD